MAKLGLTLQQLAEMGIAPPANPSLGTPLPAIDPTGRPGAPMQPQPKKPGLGKHIAGSLGDFLLQQAGMSPMYTPMLQQQRQQDAAEAQWSRRRQAEREDKQWEWQNKPREAPNGTSLMQNYEFLKLVNPGLAESYLQSQATAPPVVVTNPDGTKTLYPAGAIPSGTPTAPVGKLTPNEGGPASAPGGFPYRR